MSDVKQSINLRWFHSVRKSNLSKHAKHVAFVVAIVYMDWEDMGSIYPGVPNLAEDTGLSESSVQRGLDDLVEADYLKRVKPGRNGRATLYCGRFPSRTTKEAARPAPCVESVSDIEDAEAFLRLSDADSNRLRPSEEELRQYHATPMQKRESAMPDVHRWWQLTQDARRLREAGVA
jgi:hypothetical protein